MGFDTVEIIQFISECSFSHSLIKQIFIEHLLYAKNYGT